MQAGDTFTVASALEGRRKPMSGYRASEQAPGADETRGADILVCPHVSVRTSRARNPARGKVRGRRRPARDFGNPMSAAGFIGGSECRNASGQAALAPLFAEHPNVGRVVKGPRLSIGEGAAVAMAQSGKAGEPPPERVNGVRSQDR